MEPGTAATITRRRRWSFPTDEGRAGLGSKEPVRVRRGQPDAAVEAPPKILVSP